MIIRHDEERTELKAKLKTNKHFLKKTIDEVVKPLMHEIKVIDELNQRYKA